MRHRKILLSAAILVLSVSVASPQQGSPVAPGRCDLELIATKGDIPETTLTEGVPDVGDVSVWNTANYFCVRVTPHAGDGRGDWMITSLDVHHLATPLPLTDEGDVMHWKFPIQETFKDGVASWSRDFHLKNDLDFAWGQPWEIQRQRFVAVHVQLERMATRELNAQVTKQQKEKVHAWAWMPECMKFEVDKTAYAVKYPLRHPRMMQFVDSPVQGLFLTTPTHRGRTGEDGGHPYFPGERVDIYIGDGESAVYLGSAAAADKVTPLAVFENAELTDPRVANLARLLQSLDHDGDPRGKIEISHEVEMAFFEAFAEVMPEGAERAVDFTDDDQVDDLIDATIAIANAMEGEDAPTLVSVSPEDAITNLESYLSQTMIRKNVSKEPEYENQKQKLDIMPVYVPVRRADGSTTVLDENGNEVPYVVEYEYERFVINGYDENGDPIYTFDGNGKPITEIAGAEERDRAKPIFVTYLEQVEPEDASMRMAEDVFTAVSWDDGQTFKRYNLSRSATISSFELLTGEAFPGNCRAPVQKIAGNKIVVVWTSAYARGGSPRYTIGPDTGIDTAYWSYYDTDGDGVNDYYTKDVWGVRGHQGSVDYDEVDEVADQGIGEIAYYATWAARGIIMTPEELEQAWVTDYYSSTGVELAEGDIVWFKPERLTSARRDAFIPVVAGADGVGFAIAWQEDPDGLRPGKGKGGGVGWSGAISNKKTDIWYAWLSDADFAKIDLHFVPGSEEQELEDREDTQGNGVGRPKTLVPFSLPVRISDNNMVNTDTLKVEMEGASEDDPGYPRVDTNDDGDLSYVPLPNDSPGEPSNDDPNGTPDDMAGTTAYAYAARFMPEYAYYADELDLAYIPTDGGDLSTITHDKDAYGENYFDSSLYPGAEYYWIEYDSEGNWSDTWVKYTPVRWYDFTNTAGAHKRVVVTADHRVLDGNTSASRPNISLQPYEKNGVKSAWALLAYEETKGLGSAHADDTDGGGQVEKPEVDDYGKNVIYHTFDFRQPDLVAEGTLVNLPALDYVDTSGDGELQEEEMTSDNLDRIKIYWKDADGEEDLDSHFRQFKTEVARRVRFLAQPYGKIGDSRTSACIIFKQGRVGQGRPADAFLRRIVVPEGVQGSKNVFSPDYFEVDSEGKPVMYNMTSVSYVEDDLWYNPDSGWYPDDGDLTDIEKGNPKLLHWTQTKENLRDESFFNQLTDSKGHRGFIDGDLVVYGFSWTPNWAAQRNGHDKYDFYVRRSFDGGATWTSAPWGEGTAWEVEFKIPTDKDDTDDPQIDTFTEWWGSIELDEYGEAVLDTNGLPTLVPGGFEPMRNTSRIKNNKYTCMDPRISQTPGSTLLRADELPEGVEGILAKEWVYHPPVRDPDTWAITQDGWWEEVQAKKKTEDLTAKVNAYVIFEEDVANRYAFFVSYGTGIQLASSGTEDHGEAEADDLYYSRSVNGGDTWYEVPWLVNPDSQNEAAGTVEYRWDWLAHGDSHQGEAQLRATPDGSRLYAIWHQHSDPEVDDVPQHFAGDDIWFRRLGFILDLTEEPAEE